MGKFEQFFRKILEKVKFLWQKENRREFLYIFLTIVIIGAVVILFIWASMIVVKAINAAFVPPVSLDSDVLSIDFENLAKIASRIGIDKKEFQERPSAIVETPKKEETFCAQVITPATSPNGDCKEFPTPCDVPGDWQKVAQCPAGSAAKTAEDIDITSIKLEILNGTITPGLAASWKEKFMGAGFLSDNIKTGNADKRDYSGITVYYNSTEAIFGKVSVVLNQSNLAVKTEKDTSLDNLYFKMIIGK